MATHPLARPVAHAIPATHAAFLADLARRHRDQRHHDQPYEAMMYQARDPPTAASLQHLVDYIERERPEDDTPPTIPQDPHLGTHLQAILQDMQWPDPAPVAHLAKLLPAWDTLHVTTLMHSVIPDYPIFGAPESRGLARLGFDVPYTPQAAAAVAPYGVYVHAVKRLRDEANFEQVPESHHYLTRIVQAALEALGAETATTPAEGA